MLDLNRIAPERVRPLRRSEFDQMVELGLFDDERLELLEGALIEMTPQGAGHAEVLRRLTGLLVRAIGDRAIVQVQAPLAASDDSEPEPDLAVVPTGDYSRGHPSKALWVIEVAESSLRKDRDFKSELYATANVPEYWLIDLVNRAVEVRSAPLGGRYTRLSTHQPEEMLRPAAFPDIEIELQKVLPSQD